MNPLTHLRDWLVALTASLGLKAQMEVSDTPERRNIYLIAGSPKHGRCEVLKLTHPASGWWPVTMHGTECADVAALKELLGAYEHVARERITSTLNLGVEEKVA